MEKSRKKHIGLKPIIILVVVLSIVIISAIVTIVLMNNQKQNKSNVENQIENVVSNDKKESVQIPKIVGETFEEAKKELEKVNLKVEKIEEQSSIFESGIVFKQEPTYNTIIEEGTTVRLYVSIEE